MNEHIADLSAISEYGVLIDLGPPMKPELISTGDIPLVSIATEIKANSLTEEGKRIREYFRRIPYGSPLYWWETHSGPNSQCVYIGQTVMLALQNRFDNHTKVLRLLCRYVNEPDTTVYFRLCHRFDIRYSNGGVEHRFALEHLPLNQAQKVVKDVEAYLIYEHKPEYNMKYKKRRKTPWKPFAIEMRLIDL